MSSRDLIARTNRTIPSVTPQGGLSLYDNHDENYVTDTAEKCIYRPEKMTFIFAFVCFFRQHACFFLGDKIFSRKSMLELSALKAISINSH